MPLIGVSRRKLLIGSCAGFATSTSAALTATPKHRTYHAETYRPIPRSEDGEGDEDRQHDVAPYEPPLEAAGDAVSFWGEVTLDLVALDHSIDAKDARAPGPCASARAVAVAYVALADAVASAYSVSYEPLLAHAGRRNRDAPEAFVGGAVAWVLERIYSTPAHSQYIAAQRQRFLAGRGPGALRAWDAGLAFARQEAIASLWDGATILDRTLKAPSPYVSPPGGHTVDPFNTDQGMYGVTWSRMGLMTPGLGPIPHLGPGDPPTDYERDYNEVLEVGAYRDEPTPEQVRSGLFWAYDGARLIGTPVRLYVQVIRRILDDDRAPPQERARTLALTALAMADATTVTWAAKYHYNFIRPVMRLRNEGLEWRPAGSPRTNPLQFSIGADTRQRQTAQSLMGASPVITAQDERTRTLGYKLATFTPAFPSYPSGHASMGSAGFTMLRLIRGEGRRGDGDRINPRLQFFSDELNGLSIDHLSNRARPLIPRTFSTLAEIIEDINSSRVYLGVHWRFDCTRGAESGERIAEAIHRLAYRRRRSHRDVS